MQEIYKKFMQRIVSKIIYICTIPFYLLYSYAHTHARMHNMAIEERLVY